MIGCISFVVKEEIQTLLKNSLFFKLSAETSAEQNYTSTIKPLLQKLQTKMNVHNYEMLLTLF